MIMRIVYKGGKGSGNFGHGGRPGKVGGSLPRAASSLPAGSVTDYTIDEGMIVYHGTFEENVDSILSVGILPHPTRLRPASVFYSSNLDEIKEYMIRKSNNVGGKDIAILEFQVKDTRNVFTDTNPQYGGASFTFKKIPPEWIVGVKKYTIEYVDDDAYGHQELIAKELHIGDTIYIPLVFDGGGTQE